MTAPSIDSLATYGGELADYRPVEDPTTDRPATGANAAYASTAAMTATCPRAYVTLTGATGAAPTLVEHNSMWGSAVGVAPARARTGAGVFTLTWPSTITDGLGDTQTLNLRRAFVCVEGATACIVQATRTSANVITIHAFTHAGVADDLNGITFTVYVI